MKVFAATRTSMKPLVATNGLSVLLLHGCMNYNNFRSNV